MSKAVFSAIRKNDLIKLQALVDENPNVVHESDSLGRTPLFAATEHGQLMFARYLVSKGAKPDEVMTGKYNGLTPLHVAAIRDYQQIVKFFVEECKMDPNTPLQDEAKAGITPLFYAACKNKTHVTQYLIDFGVDANKALEFGQYVGQTPIYRAAAEGSYNIFELLCKNLYCKGLDPFEPLKALHLKGRRPIMIAAELGNYDIVVSLVEEWDVDPHITNTKCKRDSNDYGMTPLFLATFQGQNNVIAYLTRTPPADGHESLDINQFMSEGQQINPDKYIPDEYRVDPNEAIQYGVYQGATPLFIAARLGYHSTIQLLAAVGADPNCIIEYGIYEGQTPLIAAATKGYLPIVQYLVEKFRIDPFTPISQGPNQGKTALDMVMDEKHRKKDNQTLDADSEKHLNETMLYFQVLQKKRHSLARKSGSTSGASSRHASAFGPHPALPGQPAQEPSVDESSASGTEASASGVTDFANSERVRGLMLFSTPPDASQSEDPQASKKTPFDDFLRSELLKRDEDKKPLQRFFTDTTPREVKITAAALAAQWYVEGKVKALCTTEINRWMLIKLKWEETIVGIEHNVETQRNLLTLIKANTVSAPAVQKFLRSNKEFGKLMNVAIEKQSLSMRPPR